MPQWEDAGPVRPPVLTRALLGDRAWRELHDLAFMRDLKPSAEVLQLIKSGLWQSINGHDPHLNRAQLDALNSLESLEEVA